MFFRTPLALRLLYPELIWRIPTDRKVIYLTFDDGPVPGPTEFVLDELKRANAKATFFCIGNNVEKHQALFDRIKAESHAIGNHTHTHLKGWGCSASAYLQDVDACSEVVGYTKLFRPPYGRATRKQLLQLNQFKVIMWDVLSYDYDGAMNPERSLKGIIRASRGGSIVVFHDSYKAERNMKFVLPKYLDHFSEKGYVFESLDHL